MKNIYHKFLKLPFTINKPEICNSYPNDMKHIDMTEYFDSNISNWLKSLNLSVLHTEVFYTPPNGGKLPIHADHSVLDNHVKINISWGPVNAVMRWWEAKNLFNDINELDKNLSTKKDEFSNRQHNNVLAKEEDCNLVYESTTNQPSLVNVGVLHSTYNPYDQGRWTLCFVPGYSQNHQYIQWDEALQIFGNYIEETNS